MNIPKQSVPVSRNAIPGKALNQRGIAASLVSFTVDRFQLPGTKEEFIECGCDCLRGTPNILEFGGSRVEGFLNSGISGEPVSFVKAKPRSGGNSGPFIGGNRSTNNNNNNNNN